MKTITINGKKYKLVPDEAPQEEKQERKTGWERVEETEKYFYIQDELYERAEIGSNFDKRTYEKGEYYCDYTIAMNITRAIRLRLKMLQWQALNDAAVNIHDKNAFKWFIYYDLDCNKIEVTFRASTLCDEIYFSSKEKAEEALEVFKDELEWYYKDFYRRLDERLTIEKN